METTLFIDPKLLNIEDRNSLTLHFTEEQIESYYQLESGKTKAERNDSALLLIQNLRAHLPNYELLWYYSIEKGLEARPKGENDLTYDSRTRASWREPFDIIVLKQLNFFDGQLNSIDQIESTQASLLTIKEIAPHILETEELGSRYDELIKKSEFEQASLATFRQLESQADRTSSKGSIEQFLEQARIEEARLEDTKWAGMINDLIIPHEEELATIIQIEEQEEEERQRQIALEAERQAEEERRLAREKKVAEERRLAQEELQRIEEAEKRVILERARKTAQVEVPRIVTAFLNANAANDSGSEYWDPNLVYIDKFFTVNAFELKKTSLEVVNSNGIATAEIDVLVDSNNESGEFIRKWYTIVLIGTDGGWKITDVKDG